MSDTFLIAGVGRSGTKILQILLAYIIAHQRKDMSLFYEPLLWRSHELKKVEPAGIAVHKSLPMLIDPSFRPTDVQRKFFGRLGNVAGTTTVTKFIRMTGRVPLLRLLYPEARMLFIYREPVGFINSTLNVDFSLLGPPHYESDYGRLISEGRQHGLITDDQIEMLEEFPWKEEAIHWYLMNRKALQDLRGTDALVFSYDGMLKDKEGCLRRLCASCGAKYRTDYLRLFDIPGYNIRYLHELFVQNRSLPLLLGLRRHPMFIGARDLDDTSIFTVREKKTGKKKTLSPGEGDVIRDFSVHLMEELRALENRAKDDGI